MYSGETEKVQIVIHLCTDAVRLVVDGTIIVAAHLLSLSCVMTAVGVLSPE